MSFSPSMPFGKKVKEIIILSAICMRYNLPLLKIDEYSICRLIYIKNFKNIMMRFKCFWFQKFYKNFKSLARVLKIQFLSFHKNN